MGIKDRIRGWLGSGKERGAPVPPAEVPPAEVWPKYHRTKNGTVFIEYENGAIEWPTETESFRAALRADVAKSKRGAWDIPLSRPEDGIVEG